MGCQTCSDRSPIRAKVPSDDRRDRPVGSAFESVVKCLTSRRQQQLASFGNRSTNHDDLRVQDHCQSRQATTQRFTDVDVRGHRCPIAREGRTEQVPTGW